MPFQKGSTKVRADDLARRALLERALRRKQQLRQQSIPDFIDWLPLATPAYNWTWRQTRYIANKMDALRRGDFKNIMFFLPPRHTKSETVTVRYPAYDLERDPRRRVAITSATATLAEKFSRKTRQIVRSRDIVNLNMERQSVNDWLTQEGGGLRAVGVGGTIVGQGFDLLIMDDPIKAREDAESAAFRDKLWDWYTDDLFTRREPGASMVLIETRWHEDDLAGRILESNQIGTDNEWIVVSLPALCEGTDPIDFPERQIEVVLDDGRKCGEALCPERFDEEELLAIKETMGSSFDSLYQQRPTPEQGFIFKKDWFRNSVARFPQKARITQVWDTAMEKGERNDFSALVEGFRDPDSGTIYVAAMDNTRYDFPELARAMRQHRDRVGGNTELAVEDKANGKPARQQLRLQGIPVIEIPAGTKDKEVRARSITNYCEANMIVLVNLQGNLNATLVNQLLSFPFGSKDDLVDAFVHLIRRLTGNGQKWSEEKLRQIKRRMQPMLGSYD